MSQSFKNDLKIKQGKGALLVTYAVYSEMWPLHLTHPWGAVGQLQVLASTSVKETDWR